MDKNKKEPVKYIDCTPSWVAVLSWMLAALEEGNENGVKAAKENLNHMARVADMYVALTKAIIINNNTVPFEIWRLCLIDIIMHSSQLTLNEIALTESEVKQYYEESVSPGQVFFDIWKQDAGYFYKI